MEGEDKRGKGKENPGTRKEKKGPSYKVGGPDRKITKREEGGCKVQGLGKENCQEGNPRVWRLYGLWPVGLLSRVSNFIFFSKLIWQFNFEIGDDCLDKTFVTILEK